ncbi:MAG: VWA domain-containing protein [Leptospirales bacterium]|nr:VWA domain-containing protein [Leptospirales bacterium]
MKKNGIFAMLLCVFLFGADSLISQTSDLGKFEIAKTFFKKGINHYNRMEYLSAAEFFRNAIEVYPEYYSARDYLFRSYDLSGFVDAAAKEVSIMQNMYPDDLMSISRADTISFRDSLEFEIPAAGALVHKETILSSKMKNFRFSKPVDIAIDNEKNIYITSFDLGKLVKLDANGKGVFSKTPGMNSKLYGVSCYGRMVAVTDFANDMVFVYDAAGEIKVSFGSIGSGEGFFRGPQGICFGEDGYIYVVDSGNNRVQKFDQDGKYILQFGKKGVYEGELTAPTGVLFYKNKIYVTDTGNKRVSVFDVFGNFIEHLFEDELKKPTALSVSADNMLVSDNSGLFIYNMISKESSRFEQWDGGNFARLSASAFDRDGFLYCLDYAREAVFVFSPEHKQYSNLNVDIVSVDTEQFPLIAFYVNIRDRDGRPIIALDPDNFKITEDNAPIRLVSVDYLKNRLPSVSTILCIDRSLSNRKNHNELPWFADFYLTKMYRNDSIKVVGFNSDSWGETEFDWSRRRTLEAIKKDEYGSGKNIGKTLYNSISELATKLDRRAVILLTDGQVENNSFSQYSPRTIIHYARSHFIPIHIISIGPPDRTLVDIAQRTGGSLFRPGEIDRMNEMYSTVKNLEEYRYVLVYSTLKRPFFKGWWSNVRVDVDYRGMKGMQWGGYFVSE